MRIAGIISALALTVAAGSAQAQAAQPAAAATAGHYSTATTELGVLLDDPAAKAVLLKHIPEVVNNEQVDMARGMTLKDMQPYTGDALTDKMLADVDADLAKIPAKN